VKLAVVVQRYGADISGGAELHARYIAERLARHHDVEVLTTCARDYVRWRNELPAGEEQIGGVRVRRFRVSRPRDTRDFAFRSRWVFDARHSLQDELGWVKSNGPYSPSLVRYIRQQRAAFDFFFFFSFRYFHAYHGPRAAPDRAILVPTAERDPAVGLSMFAPIFKGARAVMYNSPEERALIEAASHRQGPSVVVGISSDIPDRPEAARFRRTHNVSRPFALYVGRIDVNKGCRELFDYFQRYAARQPHGLDLILIGSKQFDPPDHPRIRHLGFLPDRDKFDALAAADVLVMPSPYESLSMVVLEAWALGKPVLVNGACDVLRGQCLRGSGGLYYENAEEFAEALYALEARGPAGPILGAQGREYFRRHYAWPVIDRKYKDMLDRLQREPAHAIEPLPSFLERRRRALPPAAEVLASLPSGPVLR
jgi:glycosyltransferase involved in cell wall biosynthesis